MAKCPRCGTTKFAIEEVNMEDDKGQFAFIVCAGCDTAMSIIQPQLHYGPILQSIERLLMEINRKTK